MKSGTRTDQTEQSAETIARISRCRICKSLEHAAMPQQMIKFLLFSTVNFQRIDMYSASSEASRMCSGC